MIFVFGSCNADMVMNVSRHPNPGETLLSENYTLYAGGKGANQAVAAARANAPVTLVGAIGSDHFGPFILNSMNNDHKRYHLNLEHMIRLDAPTGCAVIAVDPTGENTIIVSGGANLRLSARHFPLTLVQENDFLILQMEVPLSENWALAEQISAKGGRILLNAGPALPIPAHILKLLDVLVVNWHEVKVLNEHAETPFSDNQQLALWAAQHFNMHVIITLGGEGAFMAEPSGQIHQMPAHPIHVVDTVAAGDTFVGYFAAALHRGESAKYALKSSLIASGLACTRPGAQASIPHWQEVEALLIA